MSESQDLAASQVQDLQNGAQATAVTGIAVAAAVAVGAPGVSRPSALMDGAFANFLLGAATELEFDDSRLESWRHRVHGVRTQTDWTSADAESRAIAELERLKSEFVMRVVAPRRYSALLTLWLITLAGMLCVELLLGSGGFLNWCKNLDWLGKTACESLYGHFVGYIAFRYALYGVLLGNALRLSYSRSRAAFDNPQAEANLLNRPLLNVILGLTVAYLLANLVASGNLNFTMLGFTIQKDFVGSDQGFRDAAALLLVGLTASIASDVYVQRLIDGARQSADRFLQKTPGAQK